MCDCGGVSAAQSGAVSQQIQIAIASKQLSAAKEQGAAVNQLLESAAQIGKSLGSGASLDVQG